MTSVFEIANVHQVVESRVAASVHKFRGFFTDNPDYAALLLGHEVAEQLLNYNDRDPVRSLVARQTLAGLRQMIEDLDQTPDLAITFLHGFTRELETHGIMPPALPPQSP